MIGEEKKLIRDTICDDERYVNEDNAPIGNENGHMRGSQNVTNLEQPYVDTQASPWAGDTLLVDADGLNNIANVRSEHVPMMRPSEGGIVGVDLAVEDVINLWACLPRYGHASVCFLSAIMKLNSSLAPQVDAIFIIWFD